MKLRFLSELKEVEPPDQVWLPPWDPNAKTFEEFVQENKAQGICLPGGCCNVTILDLLLFPDAYRKLPILAQDFYCDHSSESYTFVCVLGILMWYHAIAGYCAITAFASLYFIVDAKVF